MRYTDYAQRIRSFENLGEVAEYGQVLEGGQPYPLFRITVPGERWLVITSGFHGEEPAGPLTLAERFPEVVAYARQRGVGLRVYPCINPSGFEDGTRYNRSGEKPNNDFLRYEVAPGEWRGELNEGQDHLRWALYDGGPKETRLVRSDLSRFRPPNAALDIHQDNYLGGAATYAYTFGDKAFYRPFVEASSKHATVVRNQKVDEQNITDDDGLIVYHDGSVTDWYARQGVPYTATLETTTPMSMEACHAVNLIWIRGFIDLAARTGR
ncbi:M14 family metallocarboxypeptidase [Myxococcus llanfairpwllgwyngyllgogerychwyrndrobwllllantysiliogogogochensis]|uniref:M14 family metallocarboxypeptidase n=1 Tax=Myxococcus llanfairpwllgwyngyllgogerychwyrndrobwllllantysiliogogogochensis TaxID=2590453 RepID=A0A540X8E9_9BACT|nr:M14 family metallocarboxypeptidase [Myxococcus llanfairpwllgwyngyllgogerychwyrndrobwllllantysiliogogogochensis]TQF17586.1 M14 family metallocarboxypeptidase [Myxococcus llanfairpwllgwyngyllgogerychwyrndrobwllllantysiliogogogochensis]